MPVNDWIQSIAKLIHGVIFRFFYRFGLLGARHPGWLVGGGLLVAGAAISGCAILESDASPKIFRPSQIKTAVIRDEVDDLFEDVSAAATTIFYLLPPDAPAGANLLETKYLTDIFNLHESIWTVTDDDGRGFAELCAKPNCASSIFSAPIPWSSLDQLSNMLTNPDHELYKSGGKHPLLKETFIGDDGKMHATAVLDVFQISKDDHEAMVSWELNAIKRIFSHSTSLKVIAGNQEGSRSEVNRIVSQESPLMGGTFVLVLAFMCLLLGQTSTRNRDLCYFYRSRWLLGSTCIFTVSAALGMSFGLGAFFGIKLNTLSILVVFVLLGVGVDDMIILVHCCDRMSETRPELPLEEQLAHGLAEASNAIFLTSLTSFTSFLCASTIDFPVCAIFCIHAALGILATFVLQLSLFFGLYVLDEQRRMARRADLCCCIKSQKGAEENYSADAEPSGGHEGRGAAATPSKHSWTLERLWDSYASMLSDRRAQAAVVLFFTALIAASAALLPQISTFLKYEDYYPDDSYVQEYLPAVNRFIGGNPRPTTLLVRHTTWLSSDHLITMNRMVESFLASSYCQGQVNNWMKDFGQWVHMDSSLELADLPKLNDAEFFSKTVSDFLASKGDDNKMDHFVAFEPRAGGPGARVVASRVVLSCIGYDGDGTEKPRQTLESILEAALAKSDGSLDVVLFNPDYPTAQTEAMMVDLIVSTLVTCVVAVTSVLIIFLHPLVGILVGMVIVVIDLELLGMMAAVGLALDMTSFLILTMTVGLSVDYVCHIAHAFLAADPKTADGEALSPRDHFAAKMNISIKQMGFSIFCGGMSTFLGFSLLAGSRSLAFRAFFLLMFSCTSLGLLHGLVAVPVVMALIGEATSCCRSSRPSSITPSSDTAP